MRQAPKSYPRAPAVQARPGRRPGGRHEALVAAINFWAADSPARQQALTALDDIAVLIQVFREAGAITDHAVGALDERLDIVRETLMRFESPWGPRR
jgi:hypothetical protein